jgi:hypothetical protein
MKYAPIAECIYCGTTQQPLTDEHIIAYALGGDKILPKSSCGTCQTVTSKVERSVLREMLLQVRAQLGLPSRKKSLPKIMPLVVHNGNEQSTVELEKANHPTMAAFLLYPMPGALEGETPERGINVIGTQLYQVGGPPLKQVLDTLGTKNATFSQEFKGSEFEKMLAKIALAYAVAEHGIDGLRESPLQKIIQGEIDDVGKWIGCGLWHPEPNPNLHDLKLVESGKWLVVSVQLFAHLRTPEYLVVVRVGGETDRPTFPHGELVVEV